MTLGDGRSRPGGGGSRNGIDEDTAASVTPSTAGSALDTVTRALDRLDLGARTSGDRITARCPAHDDSTPSLSVSNGSGKVLLRCHAGCDTADVVAVLGLTMGDLFDVPAKRQDRPTKVAEYRYVDEVGELLFVVERLVPKGFRQRAADGAYRLGGTRRVLYRLPEVVDAVKTGRTVYVVEGEKDADRLAGIGVTATCNPMGAGKWRENYAASLAGAARVVIVADADKAGREHAATVAASLKGRVDLVELVEPASGKDVFDHLDAGLELAELRPVEAEPVQDAGAQVVRLSTVTPEPVEWLWPRRLPLGKLVTLDGDPSLGKSTRLAYARGVERSGGAGHVPESAALARRFPVGSADTVA